MEHFLGISDSKILYKSQHFFIIRDSYPVSPGHLLIISNELVSDFFELSREAKDELPALIDKAKELIEESYEPDGFNVGMNCGEVAGQTVMHFHCHVIPRYKEDMEDPRGGVRHCVEGKGYY
jgi:diadenosine tetraphosphate (Ap4A) HIT family hydrolase